MGLVRSFMRRLLVVLAGLFVTAALFYVTLPIMYGLFGVAVTLLVTSIVVLLLNPVADRLERPSRAR